MSNSDSKVVQLVIEPELSDKHVMDALREGITYSKTNKCKSILIVIIPEDLTNVDSFSRSYTRNKIGDVAQLFNFCKLILRLMEHCLNEMIYGED